MGSPLDIEGGRRARRRLPQLSTTGGFTDAVTTRVFGCCTAQQSRAFVA
ncbi:hypothetical protein [Streptomyces sp. NPDC050564]